MAMKDLSKMEKEDLEKLKLTSEIKESEHRVALERVNKKREDLKSLLAIAISVGTIVTAALTIGTTIDSYIKQKAQSEKLIVDQTLLNLVKKLNSDEHEYATVLLSEYGESAIPVLLKYLEFNVELESTNRLIYLLKKMQQKIGPKDFDDLFISAAEEIFQVEVTNLRHVQEVQTENNDKAKTAILNYLLALEKLGGSKEKISKMLGALKKRVEDSSPSIEEVTRTSIVSIIQRIEGGLNK